MHVLALDTVDGPLAIGLLDTATGVVTVRRKAIERGQAERLPGFVAEALDDAGWAPTDVGRIVVTTGPGGFTGVRIGAAFARGFALALGIPAFGVPSLEAIAASLRAAAGHRPLAVVVEDRRGGLYAQNFAADGTPLGEARLADAETLAASLPEDTVVAGPGAAPLASALGGAEILPGGVDPAALARLGAAIAGGPPPEPLYLRPADAVPPRPSGVTALPPPPTAPRSTAPLGSRGGDQ